METSMIQVKNCGNQMCYSWHDDLGYHQYYSDIFNMEFGEIMNFKREDVKNGKMYSWNDNTGYHQYFVFMK
jgi:hypothetical protein